LKKIASFNQRFVDMLYIPHSIIESRNHDQMMKHIMDQVLNPEKFISKTEKYYSEMMDAVGFDHIQLKD